MNLLIIGEAAKNLPFSFIAAMALREKIDNS
jgi:uncharacterized protein with HEPN domain